MASEKELALATEVFENLCGMLDRDQMKYDKNEETKTVDMLFKGEDDFAIRLLMQIDEDMQLIRVLSPLPIQIKDEKLMDFVVATNIISSGLASGTFDMDLEHRAVLFRVTSFFSESNIGDGVFKTLISCALSCVEAFFDKLVMLNNGMTDVKDFLN